MRYQLEMDIELPRHRVIDLFLDPDNLPKWQPSLVEHEFIKGNGTRDVGAQSRQVHEMNGRVVEMIQTIKVCDYPDKFSASYEGDGVYNLIENSFSEIGEKKTRWILNSEFRCSNMFMKLMTFVLPGQFKKQTLKFMMLFKEFAEKFDQP